MLLGRPWLKDAKVAHDWGSKLLPYKRIGQSKHLGSVVTRLKVLLCYNYQNGITDEKENIIFVIEPKLFSLGTICLPETI
jgi:hypothetical protein